MHESRELASDARRVGANGYVTKSDAARHLVTAIETLLSGGTFFGHAEKGQHDDPEKDPGPEIVFRLALTFS
jgi:DNA-binding NarL/FixJ family response regulator